MPPAPDTDAGTDAAPARAPTRERIAAAALREFTRRGYAATTTRDIAAAAGVNVATLHYHHGSKEELFATVAARAMGRFNAVFDEVMDRATGVRAFLDDYVDAFTDLLLEYPYLVGFIQHESERAPAEFTRHVDFAAWARRMEALMADDAAVVRRGPGAAGHLIANLVGALVYPFLFRTTTMHEFGLDDAAWEAFVRERKAVVPELVAGWLLRSGPRAGAG